MEIFARRGPIARLSRDHSSASIREGQIVKDDRTGLSLYLGGELETWACLLIVLASTAAAWWLYRLETKKEPPRLWTSSSLFSGHGRRLDRLDPCRPDLEKRFRERERGRVLIFLDGSESMTIQDKHMSPGRKLLLAERHGWLPQDQQLTRPALYRLPTCCRPPVPGSRIEWKNRLRT